MFETALSAMNRETDSGSSTPSRSAFFLRMAIRVSMSGGFRSAMSPHSNRDWKRSSSPEISLGGQSLEMTICFWLS